MHGMAPAARGVARLLAVVAVILLVLGGAYLMVRAPGSGSELIVNPPHSPVRMTTAPPLELGRAHDVMAGGGAGLFVVQQPKRGQRGRILRIDTAASRVDLRAKLDVRPLGLGVGKDVVWVVAGRRPGPTTTLLRIDPATLRVTRRLVIASPSSCATHPFASCNPVAVADGVWVPLIDRVVHVTADGRTADRSALLNGHVWDVAASGKTLWALAETALYRINEARPTIYQRISLRDTLGAGVHSNHVVASSKSVWISSFPSQRAELPLNRLTLVDPNGAATRVVRTLPYPGAGSLKLVAGGLWVDRFDGSGELDRLDAADGSITGPIVVTGDDVTWIASQKGQIWVSMYHAVGHLRRLMRITLTPTS
jgi:hypothetical protein